jgi:hypothetical protein
MHVTRTFECAEFLDTVQEEEKEEEWSPHDDRDSFGVKTEPWYRMTRRAKGARNSKRSWSLMH